jgi:hypothetical protein
MRGRPEAVCTDRVQCLWGGRTNVSQGKRINHRDNEVNYARKSDLYQEVLLREPVNERGKPGG